VGPALPAELGPALPARDPVGGEGDDAVEDGLELPVGAERVEGPREERPAGEVVRVQLEAGVDPRPRPQPE